MTQKHTGKVRHDGDNCTTQVELLWPRFHHSRGKLSGPEGRTKHVSKEVAIISVCVIGIWGMAQGVAPANIQQCVQTKPCVQIYSRKMLFFSKLSLERLRRFGGRKGKCFSRYEAKRQEVFLV